MVLREFHMGIPPFGNEQPSHWGNPMDHDPNELLTECRAVHEAYAKILESGLCAVESRLTVKWGPAAKSTRRAQQGLAIFLTGSGTAWARTRWGELTLCPPQGEGYPPFTACWHFVKMFDVDESRSKIPSGEFPAYTPFFIALNSVGRCQLPAYEPGEEIVDDNVSGLYNWHRLSAEAGHPFTPTNTMQDAMNRYEKTLAAA